MCVCIRLGRYLTRVLFVRSRGYKYQDMCWPKNSNAHERTYPCVHQPPSQLLLSKPQCATCWTIALVWRTKSVERPETSAAFGTTVLQLVSQTNHVLVKLNWIPKKSCILILVTLSPEMMKLANPYPTDGYIWITMITMITFRQSNMAMTIIL